MCYSGASLLAAVLRGVGLRARVCPEGGPDAWQEARRHTTGDECYPQRVVLADLLEALRESHVRPGQAAVFLTTGDGPCRFGQYAPYLARALRQMGLGEVEVLSPNSDNGYREMGTAAPALRRSLWWAVLAADVLRHLLHQTRPYEVRPGAADRAHEESLGDLSTVLEGGGKAGAGLQAVAHALARSRERFRGVACRQAGTRPLIGVVGEIFCRLNTYSNDDVIRRIEALGGEAWLSGVAEWVWYSNALEFADLRRTGLGWSRRMLSARMTGFFQRRDERVLLAAVEGAFAGREEPHGVRTLLELARPYLPWEGALGEMVLSVGKAVWLRRRGADGVLDVSPFGCMNGIVSEAVYPIVSREEGGIPIRSLYVDKATSRMDEGLELFVELARDYRRRKPAAQPLGAVHGGEPCTAAA